MKAGTFVRYGVETRDRLQIAVEQQHRCCAELLVRMPVTVAVNGSEWHGMVEAFDLREHPFARRCYAWEIGNETVTALKHYPIRNAEDAVRSWLQRNGAPHVKSSWWQLFFGNGSNGAEKARAA